MNALPLHRNADRKRKDEPVNSPGHDTMPVENRAGTDAKSGTNETLAWGARTDIGLVRTHDEDSFLVQPPVFAVCDGMGGHAAGEVASSIAVSTNSTRRATFAASRRFPTFSSAMRAPSPAAFPTAWTRDKSQSGNMPMAIALSLSM